METIKLRVDKIASVQCQDILVCCLTNGQLGHPCSEGKLSYREKSGSFPQSHRERSNGQE